MSAVEFATEGPDVRLDGCADGGAGQRQEGETVRTYRAVARHRVGADAPTRRRELLEGITQAAYEACEAGASISDVESAVEGGLMEYDDDHPRREAAS